MPSIVVIRTAFTIVIILLHLTSTTKAQQDHYDERYECDKDTGNYTDNSTFKSNLKQLLHFLDSKAFTTGFYNNVRGSIPDRVYGLYLCRGDVDRETCRTCIETSSKTVQDKCQTKAAVIFYEKCMLRYSYRKFNFRIHANNKIDYAWNDYYATWPRFSRSLLRLLGELRHYAAYNTSAPPPPMFATGFFVTNRHYPNITAVVQCTRDLTPEQCNQCLADIISKCQINGYSDAKGTRSGGRIDALSCNLRYELYDFYYGTPRIYLPVIAGSNDTSNREGNKKIGIGTLLAIVIPLGLLQLTSITCTCFFWRRNVILSHRLRDVANRARDGVEKAKGHEIAAIKSLLYDLPTIRNATDNFSKANKLGEGGFGVVYLGKLEDGQEIAVKKLLAKSSKGIEELNNELALLVKLQHKNLVMLLGLCLDGEEKMLIYEYMHNKSLDNILFDPSKKGQLGWEKRYNIICGIAQGLLYLHEESQIKIIHRDLKASNILLDSHMNPKISDFGLARLFGDDQTQAITGKVVGTIGYMSPEYAYIGQFSNKSDVFSFGILVLEIVTGRKSIELQNKNSMNLLGYIWQHWSNETVSDIMDPSFVGNYNQVEALRCIQIGLLCVQEEPSDRPTLSAIVLMLNGNTIPIRAPSQPPFTCGFKRSTYQNNVVDIIDEAEEVRPISSTMSES